ncbi:MAG TPA: YkgJ family cysteine cluster protein [Acidobacteriaceae bacterium]
MTLRASLQVPTGETNVTQLLPILQKLTNTVVAATVEQVQAGGAQISCHAGCGACCRQLVPLSVFEAEALAQWIRSLPAEQQDDLQHRFHTTLLTLRDSGVLARLKPELWQEGSLESREVVIEYLAAKAPCPFLKDESCGIYPIRPLICREYLVTTPPEYCEGPRLQEVEGVRMPLKLSKALNKLGSKAEGAGAGWIPLVFLFHWMRSGAEPGKAMAGAGPQVLYDVIAELES